MPNNTTAEVVGLQSANDDLSPLDPLTDPVVCGGTYCASTYSDKTAEVGS
jgi:hypothetical protein